MISLFATPTKAAITALAGGGALVATAATLMPSSVDLAAVAHRAAAAFGRPGASAAAVAPVPGRTPAMLAALFAQGKALTLPELKWLLATSTTSADLPTLVAITRQIEQHEPVASARVAWDILAGNRPNVAHAWLEQRPDRAAPALWPLRFELGRRSGDMGLMRSMVQSAAMRPGTAPPAQLIAAAYAAQMPEAIVTAAEHRAVPPLDAALSLDLVRRAVSARRADLVARIDRAGTPAWRNADPWLALTLARAAGDYGSALHYAALLPSGRDEARRSLILASGDRPAIRSLLLEQAAAPGARRAPIAQQLLDNGFRADAIAVLQAESAGLPPSDPSAARLLYLMGPRPDASGLQWLRTMAARQPDWRQPYLEREKPAAALAWLGAQSTAATTPDLLQRLRLASAAHDGKAGADLVALLLDGRALSPAELALVAANAPPRLDSRWALALSRARLASGSGLPQDRLDLAWDAWKRGRAEEARAQLEPYLAARPNDGPALRLMAEIAKKRGGDKGARPWWERALATTAPTSLERAQVLEQLGRTGEALAVIQTLRAAAPTDRRLTAFYGRLLVASGDPGRARKVLQP